MPVLSSVARRHLLNPLFPVSRFGGGNRAVKKQGVIDKLKSFFEKFFGVSGSFAEHKTKNVNYTDMIIQ